MKTKTCLLLCIVGFVISCSHQEPEPEPTSVTDCQGHVYPIVKMGERYWMAENLKCTKYDTESEKSGQILSNSEEYTFAPYCIDGKSKIGNYSTYLSDLQRKKLGLLYNWAAATGLSEQEVIAQNTSFNTIRQGICPNGYHLPTDAEWQSLIDFVGANAATKIKINAGWYQDEYCIAGTDEYGFSVLPAGYAMGSDVVNIGYSTSFWSSTAISESGAFLRDISFCDADVYRSYYGKYYAHSVRCVRN